MKGRRKDTVYTLANVGKHGGRWKDEILDFYWWLYYRHFYVEWGDFVCQRLLPRTLRHVLRFHGEKE